ncbi:MAG: hypothetical protein JXQ69_01085 [Paludibacteraceae bacterium]|nr:hypothetical protein [Paludibacteraceae bacterium]
MALLDYIKGKRYGKEANRLERESMEDAFLQEALDGYDTVLSNHLHSIERLEKTITFQSTYKSKRKTLFYYSIAASITIVLGISSYFFFKPSEGVLLGQQQEMAIPTNAEKIKQTTAADTKAVDNNLRTNKLLDVKQETQQDKQKLSLVKEKITPEKKTVSETIKKAQQPTVAPETASVETQKNLAVSSKRLAEMAVLGKEVEKAKASTLASSADQNETTQAAEPKREFGKKQFKAFFMSKVKKQVCGTGKASVEVSFTLNGNQYPSSFRIKKFSCEEAKNEVIRILSYSPRWTLDAGEQVRMRLDW